MRVLFLATLFPAACGSAAILSIDQRFDAFDRFDRESFGMPERERANAIAAKFDALFAGMYEAKDLRSRSDEELDLLYRAAFDAGFYSFDPRYVDLQLLAGAELERRGKATHRHFDDTYGSLIQVRRLEEARAFQAKHPEDLTPLPAMKAVPSLQHSRWVISEDHKTLLQVPLDIGTGIVVMAHPLCHFTQNAVETLSTDPEMRQLFSQHATLIVPPERDFKVELVDDWNAQHPDFSMSFLNRHDEWPVFSAFATPTFYFFKDGKLVRTVEGWPKEGNRAKLLEAATAIGLAPARVPVR